MNNIKDLRTRVFNKFELPENEHNIYALKDKLKSMGFILKKTTDLRKKETWLHLLNEDFDTIAKRIYPLHGKSLQELSKEMQESDNRLQELEEKYELTQENKELIKKTKSMLFRSPSDVIREETNKLITLPTHGKELDKKLQELEQREESFNLEIDATIKKAKARLTPKQRKNLEEAQKIAEEESKKEAEYLETLSFDDRIAYLSKKRERLRKEGEEILYLATLTSKDRLAYLNERNLKDREKWQQTIEEVDNVLARAEETLSSSEIYESAIDNAEITPSIDGCTAIILDFPAQATASKKNAKIAKKRSKDKE